LTVNWHRYTSVLYFEAGIYLTIALRKCAKKWKTGVSMKNFRTGKWRLLGIKTTLLIVTVALLFGLFEWPYRNSNLPRLDLRGLVEKRCVVEKVVLDSDKDCDGLYDLDDIVQGYSLA
jgi:hypothetical protein